MRLLKVPEQFPENGLPELVDFPPDRIPPYAILSHRWGSPSDEVLFADLNRRDSCQIATTLAKRGFIKVQYCYRQARQDGLDFVWVRTRPTVLIWGDDQMLER